MGRLAYRDVLGRGELLEARGGVHHVAGDDALALDGTGAEVDDRLARRNAGAGRKDRGFRFHLHASNRVDDRGRGAHRALGVVLVCEWSSEDRHHGVACELLQRAAEALHFAPGTHEVLTLERTHVLGIGLLRACSEADKVDEDDPDELSFLVRHGPSSYRNAESSPRLQGFERGFDPVVRLPTGDDFPSDVVGWDGYLYPWTFSVHDFEPITGRIHQP